MRVLLIGASGMVGQGVLRECLEDPGVTEVLAVVRSPLAQAHPRLRTVVHRDFLDFSALGPDLEGVDACFWCLGVSAAGLDPADYERITRDFTLAGARALLARSPGASFAYVSGAGTDAEGRAAWARVKGRTENDLLALPFRAVHCLRPGAIQATHGEVSGTRLYRVLYRVLNPFLGLLRRLAPDAVATTDQLGRAMLALARGAAPSGVLDTAALRRLDPGPIRG